MPAADGTAKEFSRYLTVVACSAGVNAGVYAVALLLAPTLSPLVALMLGSAAGLGLSFGGFERFGFPAGASEARLIPPA